MNTHEVKLDVKGSRDGAVVRALAFYQCRPGLNLGPGVIQYMWVEFDVGSHPCPKGFLPSTLVLLPPQKPTFLNFILIWKQWIEEPLLWISIEISIYYFILFIFY